MEININFLNLASVKHFHREEEFHLLEISYLLLKCTPGKMSHIKHMINGAFITSSLGWSGLIQTDFTSDVLHVKTRVHQINHGSFPRPAFT
jgi:hypothetical protein